MMINLCNTGIEPVIVEYGEITFLIDPNETQTIEFESAKCLLKIHHIANDKFNALWYVMNELFTLEQMRTVLVVDGLYEVYCTCDNSTIKFLTHEYVFDRNTSYQTFIFCTEGCSIARRKLKVANEEKIIQRAKVLFLFGGNKTLLPLTGVVLLASIIKLLIYGGNTWFLIMILALMLGFVLCLINYFLAIKKLKHAMESTSILAYLSSGRKEYKKFTDELVQQYIEINKGENIYS